VEHNLLQAFIMMVLHKEGRLVTKTNSGYITTNSCG
jgi:hypothetical protein